MFENLKMPQVGETWSNGFYDVEIKDIWNSKSEATGYEFKTIVCTQANHILHVDAVVFSLNFQLVEAESFTEKDKENFELDQIRAKLNRLLNLQ